MISSIFVFLLAVLSLVFALLARWYAKRTTKAFEEIAESYDRINKQIDAATERMRKRLSDQQGRDEDFASFLEQFEAD